MVKIVYCSLFFCILLLMPLDSAHAELSLRTEIQSIANVSYLQDRWFGYGMAKTTLHLKSRGNKVVSGAFRLSVWANSDGTSQFSIPLDFAIERAFIQFRIPAGTSYRFRIQTGKTRLSWGEGILFNAADVLFGSEGSNVDFTAETLRDESTWLLSFFFPTGQFSFFEPFIALPFTIPSLIAKSLESKESFPDASKLKTGIRFRGRIGAATIESGYMYNRKENLHIPTLALQFHLGVDWYFALSSYFPSDSFRAAHISGGFFSTWNIASSYTISLRMETLIQAAKQQSDNIYSIFLEKTFASGLAYSISLRALYNIHDTSGMLSFGTSFTAIEGLSFTPYLTWLPKKGNLKSTSLSLILRYIF